LPAGNPLALATRLLAYSQDGKISAGFAQYGGAQDRWPARWDASGKGVLLTPLPASTFDTNTAPGEALANLVGYLSRTARSA
jgi:hypothetical protein